MKLHTRLTGPEGSGAPVMTLKAYREDGTEVLPGDTIIMTGISHPFTFRAALTASNSTGTDGLIATDGYPDMFASPFGLTVRAVPVTDEPEWEASNRFPGDIRRNIRGPGGFHAVVTPAGAWLIIDSSDGEMVTSHLAHDREAGKQAVLDWEREHGLVPEDDAWISPVPDACGRASELTDLASASSVRSELPVSLDAVLAVVNDNRAELLKAQRDLPEDGASSERDAYLGALEKLADAVRDYLAPDPERTAALAAEADRIARTTAPPVPGVTQNTGHTVYAVLGHQPASPGLLESWIVAAADDRGEHVTWTAYASDDGSGRLHYDSGHYHSPGLGTDSEALLDLAERAGVFRRLTELSSGPNSRTAFQDSHAKVLDELAGTWGVGRARVRSGLLEAAALGYARISWHHGGERRDYGIRYDRYRCTFSWDREH